MRNLMFLPLLGACQIDLHTHHHHYGSEPELSLLDPALTTIWEADADACQGLDASTGEVWARTWDEQPLDVELCIDPGRVGYDLSLRAGQDGTLCVVDTAGEGCVPTDRVVLDTNQTWAEEYVVELPVTVTFTGRGLTRSLTVHQAWSSGDHGWTGRGGATITVEDR